jgi:hypothetical protein
MENAGVPIELAVPHCISSETEVRVLGRYLREPTGPIGTNEDFVGHDASGEGDTVKGRARGG